MFLLLDAGFVNFGPEIQILRKKSSPEPAGNVLVPESRSKCGETNLFYAFLLSTCSWGYTWVDEYSIRRLVQGILEGNLFGWSGLFMGGYCEVSGGKIKEFKGNVEENYPEKNQKIVENPIE